MMELSCSDAAYINTVRIGDTLYTCHSVYGCPWIGEAGGRGSGAGRLTGEQQQQQQQEIPGKIRTSTARRNAVFLASAAAVRTFPDTKQQQQHDSGLQRNGDMLKCRNAVLTSSRYVSS
jgi:hypothetical protein